MVEAKRLSDSSWTKAVRDYVVNRQNEDGGYAFCQGSLESSAQDTYYGLSILKLLKITFPNLEKTEKFISEIRLDNIYSSYYVTKVSMLLGKNIGENLKKQLSSILNSRQYFGSASFFSEVSSEFTTTFMALELANLLKIDVNTEKVTEWILGFKNEDEGFGASGQSNINSTYYAIASMNLLNRNLKDPCGTVRFLRACEKPYGGFTLIPVNLTAYIEYTCYGMMALDLLGEKSKYPTQTVDWIFKCQNKNGGFARSDLGISTFGNTFKAVNLLRKISGYL